MQMANERFAVPELLFRPDDIGLQINGFVVFDELQLTCAHRSRAARHPRSDREVDRCAAWGYPGHVLVERGGHRRELSVSRLHSAPVRCGLPSPRFAPYSTSHVAPPNCVPLLQRKQTCAYTSRQSQFSDPSTAENGLTTSTCSPLTDAYKASLAFARSPAFATVAVTREEYLEHGKSIYCRRKFRGWNALDAEAEPAPVRQPPQQSVLVESSDEDAGPARRGRGSGRGRRASGRRARGRGRG
jgi:hypothetical protein